VISIGKLTNAEAAVEYLQHAIDDSALHYYVSNGESPGRWDGTGAEHLGLRGEVTPDQLRALLNGVDPMTGKRLAKQWDSQRIVAFDVTFSAPKSVSLLYALGDDDTRRAVLEAHEAGVTAALAYMQKHAGYARLYNPATGKVEPVAGEMVMPRFLHRTARPVTDPTTGETTIDPQLHTHVPIPTWVCRPDGSWSALLSEPLYTHAASAGAVGQAAMRKHLIDCLGVEVEVVPNGTFEVVGITEAQRREFSKRRQQIEIAQSVFDVKTKTGMETATLATREGKEEVGVGPQLVERWHLRARSVDLTPEQIPQLLHRRYRAREFQLSSGVIAELVGPRSLTEEAATFSRRDIVRKLAVLATDGMTQRDIEIAADTIVLDRRHVVPLGSKKVAVATVTQSLDVEPFDPTIAGSPDGPNVGAQAHPLAHTDGADQPLQTRPHGSRHESERVVLEEPRYSTPEMVTLERRMLEVAGSRKNGQAAAADPTEAIARRPTLSAEQRAMVQTICASGDGVIVVEGVAGAGKTFAVEACREAFEASGHTVVGFALAGRAAQELEESTQIPSHTIARAIPHLLRERLAAGTVVIVDEAGMVGCRQMAQLVELTSRDGAKLVLCGDSRQLQPVDAGTPFRLLGDHLGRTELKQSMRHSEMWERVALGLIREGEIPTAVDMYKTMAALTSRPT
jgi:conjugative relaxase-like TrwC/TraI family protein